MREPSTAKSASRGQPKRPRQSDVAKRAGVSPAIVSLVLNGRLDKSNVRISQETQQRVWQAIRELGYVPNPVARSLAGGSNRLLGVFTYEAVFPMAHSDFYYPFLVGIEQEAERHGYDLLLFTRSDSNGQRKVYHQGINRLQLAEGAVLLGLHSDRAELARLQQEGFPFVFVGRREAPDSAISYSAADYASATQQVVGRLLDLGHRRISYLRASGDSESSRDRQKGYLDAFSQRGLSVPAESILQVELNRKAAGLIRQQIKAGVSAIVAEQPDLALRVVEVAAALGLEIPRDLSVATLGDTGEWPGLGLELTTFQIPRQQMGSQAVRLLLERLANPQDSAPKQVVLPCTFVPGNTIAPPKE